MRAWAAAFRTIPLPYRYVQIPQPNDRPNRPSCPLYYRVNRVIVQLTRQAFSHCGFQEISDIEVCNTSWGRQYAIGDYSRFEAWQKVNHFAGAFLLGRKDNLHKRMTELKARTGAFARFYPETYLLPEESAKLAARWTSVPIWIVKPFASARGQGIQLLLSEKSPPPSKRIVQAYIERPFLITKRKFDIRLYAIVPSIRPLRIYLHSNGLVRFCTHEYEGNQTNDLHMHLTNFSLNKTDPAFVRAPVAGEVVTASKWSLAFFTAFLRRSGIDPEPLFHEFERVTIATIIAGISKIRETHWQYVRHRHTSYEIYGLDLLLDADMNVHLMEINLSPAMSGLDSTLDANLKLPVNLDALRMARIIECDAELDDPCPGVELLDEYYFASVTPERRCAVEKGEIDAWSCPVFADFVMVRDFLEEQELKTGFRLIYPVVENLGKFTECFDRMEYWDLVFHSWVCMPAERKVALASSPEFWAGYAATMDDIAVEIGEEDDLGCDD
jgi:tubulin polyglutamylase TTLL4